MSAAHTNLAGRIPCPVSSQGNTGLSEKKSQTLQQADTLDILKSREKCFLVFKIWKLNLRLGLKRIVAVVRLEIKDHFSTDLQWSSSERWCWVCRKLRPQLVLLFMNTEDSALDEAHLSSFTEWWDSSLAGSFLLGLVLSLPNFWKRYCPASHPRYIPDWNIDLFWTLLRLMQSIPTPLSLSAFWRAMNLFPPCLIFELSLCCWLVIPDIAGRHAQP